MRVIAGSSRGRILSAPPGVTTRPTSDRVKEALFSILSCRIDVCGISVLDICAGTGALGIEALSRGASSCFFIENGMKVTPVLEKNLLITGYRDISEIVVMDAFRAVHFIAGRGQRYHLVFFDPPYGSELYESVPDALESSGMLLPGAVLVVECSVRKRLPEAFGRLKRFDRREYGDTALELYALEEI